MVPKTASNASKSNPTAQERKAFLLRVPAELIEELRGWAEDEYRSMNAQVEFVLRDALARRQ